MQAERWKGVKATDDRQGGCSECWFRFVSKDEVDQGLACVVTPLRESRDNAG